MTTATAATTASPFALERPQERLTLFLILLGAAVLSPNIPLPGPLPAVRLEQLIMAAALPSLLRFHLRNREYLRVTALDIIFVLLALAISASVIFAPTIVPSVSWSFRDPFEIARIVEYWLMYRFGMTLLPNERTSRTIIYTLLGASLITVVFSLVQYLDGQGSFNDTVTDWWAVGHNLLGLQREGRVLGTIGNANYYSAFLALPIIAGLALILLKHPFPNRRIATFVVVCIVASVFGAVLSQSRTGAASIFFGMTCGLILVLAMRRPAAPFRAIGLFLGSIALAVIFIQIQPPFVDSFNSRFNPYKVGDDASFIIRIQRFKTFFTGFFADKPAFCEGDTVDKRTIAPSHAPRNGASVSTAGEDVLARDATRKADVAIITSGVFEYFCDEDAWPVGDLPELLVPKYLSEMPVDPATGQPYLANVEGSGFWIGAELEDPADPSGPNYTLGTNPNIIRNPSFEGSQLSPTWGAREGASLSTAQGQGLFGNDAAHVVIPPGGDVRQFIVFDFPLRTDHVAAGWVKSASGQDERIQLYLVATDGAGNNNDGFAKTVVTAPASGEWVPIAVPFRTDPDARWATIQYMLRSEDAQSSADVLVDGATITQGSFAPSFVNVSDVDPSTLRPVDLPQFSDSPLVGVGPRNDAESGAFDNEYVLFLDHHGLLGAGPYLAMYIAAIALAVSAFRKRRALMDVMGLAGFAYTFSLLLFNVGAGSYYHFALMAIYWLFFGYLASSKRLAETEAVRQPAGESSPSPAGQPAPLAAPAAGGSKASVVRRG